MRAKASRMLARMEMPRQQNFAPCDGDWLVTASTPMGEQQLTLMLVSEGESLWGNANTPYGPQSFKDGTAKNNGTELAWEFDVTKPMPMTLKFTAKVTGDTIDGKVSAGMLGKFEFHGTRQ